MSSFSFAVLCFLWVSLNVNAQKINNVVSNKIGGGKIVVDQGKNMMGKGELYSAVNIIPELGQKKGPSPIQKSIYFSQFTVEKFLIQSFKALQPRHASLINICKTTQCLYDKNRGNITLTHQKVPRPHSRHQM
jgi:hypothetical protein